MGTVPSAPYPAGHDERHAEEPTVENCPISHGSQTFVFQFRNRPATHGLQHLSTSVLVLFEHVLVKHVTVPGLATNPELPTEAQNDVGF